MTNNINIELKISDNNLEIIVDGLIKKRLSTKKKTINTKEIFDMFAYDRTKKYKLDCKKIPEKELKGEDNEIKRLYNYTFDLFDEIVKSVNDTTKKLTKVKD